MLKDEKIFFYKEDFFIVWIGFVKEMKVNRIVIMIIDLLYYVVEIIVFVWFKIILLMVELRVILIWRVDVLKFCWMLDEFGVILIK